MDTPAAADLLPQDDEMVQDVAVIVDDGTSESEIKLETHVMNEDILMDVISLLPFREKVSPSVNTKQQYYLM